MDDFRAFFDNRTNAAAIYTPAPAAKIVQGHAVALVGYNNAQQYWIAKNSWGKDWADGGFFKVAYGACSILTPTTGEAYGVVWQPDEMPAASQLSLTPGPKDKAGCHLYKARAGDYMSKIAWLAGIDLEKFMIENAGIVEDLDAPLKGISLLVCNATRGYDLVSEPTGSRDHLSPNGVTQAGSLDAHGRTAETHRIALARAKQLQQQWARMTPTSCSKQAGTLCGHDVSGQAEYLSIMSSPAVYDACNPNHTGGVNLVNPPLAQGDCAACVAYSVTAAAESATAARLHVDVASFPRISPSYFFFCTGRITSCNKGWQLDDALMTLSASSHFDLVSERCFPWKNIYSEEGAICKLKCTFEQDHIPEGHFSYTRLPAEALITATRAQRHIRKWGGVVSKFLLNKSLYRSH
eukprot:GHUV01006498.1.p1 GENE.GHUV01006498.1~~GHUV01006498.1.p1  ORF type:complete len:408 (+),score=59.39 GHUV01006498.1:557-1780(+)